MAADLFTVIEDLRIDSRVMREYGGIRRASRMVQESELERRPDIRTLPLQQAFVENLIRASLDGEATMQLAQDPSLPILAAGASPSLRSIREAEARRRGRGRGRRSSSTTSPRWCRTSRRSCSGPRLGRRSRTKTAGDDAAGARPGRRRGRSRAGAAARARKMPYESPEQVDFRGDFKPELVQLLMRMRLTRRTSRTAERACRR